MQKYLIYLITIVSLSIDCALAESKGPNFPRRIVSMSLASDEILLELLKNCGGTNRIAALSILVDDSTSSNSVNEARSVSGRVHSEPESIFRQNPDLVIAATFNRPEVLNLLRNKKINLLVLDHFSSAIDIANHILEIGERTNCQDQAKKMHLSFMSKLENIPKVQDSNTKRPVVINYSPDMTIMAKDTLFDDLVSRAGAINAASQKGLKNWPKIDGETLIAMQPDKIIVLGEKNSMEQQILRHAIWKKLDAVKKKSFIYVSPRTSLSTSHYFANAVEELRLKLHEK